MKRGANVANLLLLVGAIVWISSAVVADEPPPHVSSCELCLTEPAEVESGYACQDPALVITTETEEIYAMFRLEGPIYEPHVVSSKWYAPVYGLFTEFEWPLPAPSSAGYDWWTWYVDWTCLQIADAGPSLHPGLWRVDIYVDGQLACSKEFEMALPAERQESIEQGMADALELHPPASGSDVTLQVDVGSEAAGFLYRILYATALGGGTYKGIDVELGPDVEGLVHDARLDEYGCASATVPWPGEAPEYYFQVVVAINPQALDEGDFWQTSPVQQTRVWSAQDESKDLLAETTEMQPAQQEVQEPGSGADDLFGQPGNDNLYGCVASWPGILDERLTLSLGPSLLRCDRQSGVSPTLECDGSAVVRGDEPNIGQSVLCYLPVNLPAVSCCTELHLRELRLCYQCLSANDEIDQIELGYLNDQGVFVSLAESFLSLTNTAWDCATIYLNGAIAPRALLIRFLLNLGGGAAGGVRFGNIGVILSPSVATQSMDSATQPLLAEATCASVCVGMLERGSAEPFIWCWDGYDLSPPTSAYEEAPPTSLAIGLINNCDLPIRCTRWEIIDSTDRVLASGSGFSIESRYGTPQMIGSWDVTHVPEGAYWVIAQTDIGRLSTRVTIVRSP